MLFAHLQFSSYLSRIDPKENTFLNVRTSNFVFYNADI